MNMQLTQRYSKGVKGLIYKELKEAGFEFKKYSIIPPDLNNKDELRRAHQSAKLHLLQQNAKWILNNEKRLIEFFANGTDVIPEKINRRVTFINNNRSFW